MSSLLATHGPAFARIARAYGDRTGETDDLHQEILLQLWRALPGYRGTADLGTWAYRVALNTALTWQRRHRRRIQLTGEAPPDRAGHASAGATPEAILGEFLGSLDAIDRAVLVLYMDGIAQRAIGKIVGMSEGAVAVRIHRVKRQFEERYLTT